MLVVVLDRRRHKRFLVDDPFQEDIHPRKVAFELISVPFIGTTVLHGLQEHFDGLVLEEVQEWLTIVGIGIGIRSTLRNKIRILRFISIRILIIRSATIATATIATIATTGIFYGGDKRLDRKHILRRGGGGGFCSSSSSRGRWHDDDG